MMEMIDTFTAAKLRELRLDYSELDREAVRHDLEGTVIAECSYCSSLAERIAQLEAELRELTK